MLVPYDDITDKEESIHRRLSRVFRDMREANLCIFVNDGTLEVYRGQTPPRKRNGAVDNRNDIMSFSGEPYCTFDGGATL